MKYSVLTFFAGACALILASCGTTNSGTKGAVTGIVPGAAGQTISLKSFGQRGMEVIASTEVAQDGQFTLTPESGLSKDYYFVALDDDNFVPIITDSTQALTLTLNGETLSASPQASGSPETQELFGLLSTLRPMMDEVQTQMELARDPAASLEERTSAKNEAKDAQNELQKACGNFIRENAASPAALEALGGLSIKRSLKSYETVLAAQKTTMGHSTRYKMVEAQVENAKKKMAVQGQAGGPQIGQEAPDIEMMGIDGKTRKLSDLRGKVVLIDFWASWCQPCRRENPNVVKAYADYKDKGFEVFSVSLDKQQERWEMAVEQDGLVWPNHVSDLLGWKNAAAAKYDVHSIPATFLIDQEGKVVGTKLRGVALEAKLQELLGPAS